jgi:DNA-binding transcriptional regulator YhcF (GntR family)
MIEKESIYYKGHIIVSAIRLFIHQKGVQPSVKDLCQMTYYSREAIYFILSRLEKEGIVEIVRGAFDEKIYLKDHTRLESLPKDVERIDLKENIDRLQEETIKRQMEIENLQKSEAGKKRELFAELEKRLKGAIKGTQEEKS